MTRQAESTIRIAQDHEAALVGEVIATELWDDPITVCMVPDPADRPAILPGYFTQVAAGAIEAGVVYVFGEFEAVGVWFDASTPEPEPGPEPDPALVDLCGRYAGNFHALEHQMYRAQPKGPAHHHLAFLAVRRELRGQGVGTLLLDAHHATLDQAGLASYLDASNPDSRRLYLRHGYTDLSEPFYAEGGAPMWPMWRPAATGARS